MQNHQENASTVLNRVYSPETIGTIDRIRFARHISELIALGAEVETIDFVWSVKAIKCINFYTCCIHNGHKWIFTDWKNIRVAKSVETVERLNRINPN